MLVVTCTLLVTDLILDNSSAEKLSPVEIETKKEMEDVKEIKGRNIEGRI